MKKLILSLTISSALTACASLPDVEIAYYAAKSEPTITLTQSLTCDKNFTNVFQAANLTSSVAHSADTSKPFIIKLKEFDGLATSGNVVINHYPDGRLNSINGASTGQGLPIIQGVTSVAGSLFGLGLDRSQPLIAEVPTVDQAKLITDICGVINPRHPVNAQAVDGVMMLTYTTVFKSPLEHDDMKLEFKASASTELALKNLNMALKATLGGSPEFIAPTVEGKIARQDQCLVKQVKTNNAEPYGCIGDTNEVSNKSARKKQLRVQSSKLMEYTVRRGFHTQLSFIAETNNPLTANVSLADDQFYYIPFKSRNLFGQNNISFTLTPMGTLDNLSYNSTSGVSNALSAANTVLNEFQGQTAQEAANEIAQTQRLIRCQADPATCQ